VGLACRRIETLAGWLIFCHGVRVTTAGQIYRLGLALADLNQPWRLLHRSAEWILGPQAYYERVGGVGDVVFPTGVVARKDTDELRLYYGAADSTIAVATAKLSEVIDYILSSPISHH
jgi:beta-1,4-mannooligosaccharide/beta-1,4-mannosyl-N-acetylglucosamine phosphorylase